MSITKQQFAVSLAKIINYLEADEAKNYAATDGVLKDHIYLDIAKIRDYMRNASDYEPYFNNEYLPQYLVIESSSGEFIVDLATGVVMTRDLCNDAPDDYKNIDKFDLNAWRNFYEAPIPPHLDILDLGYWLNDGQYIPAEDSYRKEKLEYMNKGDK